MHPPSPPYLIKSEDERHLEPTEAATSDRFKCDDCGETFTARGSAWTELAHARRSG